MIQNIKTFLGGFVMALANVIPGVSGGTMAVIMGIYDKVISLFDIGFVGIDFMFSDGKMILNEIEDVVGARMLYHLTDLDVVDIYVEHILKTIG